MDGEFVIEESFGMQKAIGGGNFLILADSQQTALAAAEAAVAAIRTVPGDYYAFSRGDCAKWQ